MTPRNIFCCGVVLCTLVNFGVFGVQSLEATEHLQIQRNSQPLSLSGEVVAEGKDGNMLFRTRDDILWFLEAAEIVSRKRDDTPFKYYSNDELANQLQREMPDGFRIHQTANYWICYNTSPAYAQWVGSLYERLYKGFFIYWKNQNVDVVEPERPLIVYVFKQRKEFVKHATPVFGGDPGGVIGYYHMLTNRVVSYDLTGGQTARDAGQINKFLSQPRAGAMVATIVHEATHQLAFNSRLQNRFADLPFWVGEGLAVYFETPDLESRRGWRGIGNVNQTRLTQMRGFLRLRTRDSLETLISTDERFRDGKQVLNAYAEAWALNYFLIRTKRKEYISYIKFLSEKKPMNEDGPEKRIEEFKQFFGSDLAALDREFMRYVLRLR